jgi:hypothetical protein
MAWSAAVLMSNSSVAVRAGSEVLIEVHPPVKTIASVKAAAVRENIFPCIFMCGTSSKEQS